MVQPLVSVVILAFNGIEYLRDCLSSVLAQTYPNIEVIVVDNASQDGSPEFVEEKFSSVRLISNSSNLGFAAGNNVGIRATHGDYIVLLNQDTKVVPNLIEELVNAAEQDNEIGMCASKILYMYEPKRLNSTGFLLLKDLSGLCKGIGEIDRGQYEQQEDVLAAHGAAAFYRRAMLEEIGLFDEDYFLFSEEIDLALRGRFVGWRCVYVPSAVVYHARSTHTGLYSPLKLYYGERNRIWNVVKFLPFPLVISSLFFTFRNGSFCTESERCKGPSGKTALSDKIRIHFSKSLA